MNDEQRREDELMVGAAREAYNVPPETPRDEMWSVIEARLEAGAPAPIRIDRARAARRRAAGRLSWWMGVAAALVIGLGIGRLSLGTGEGEPRTASRPAGSQTTEPATTEIPLAGLPETGEAADTTFPAGRTVRPTGDASPESPREATTAMRDGGTRPAPYATATRAHLSRSETFLAGVRVDLAVGSTDAEFEAWARSLLSRTRLLLASPAGRDPETRRLLEDLELMLAQVVMTASTNDPAEVRLLGEGLEDGDLLQRLRTSSL